MTECLTEDDISPETICPGSREEGIALDILRRVAKDYEQWLIECRDSASNEGDATTTNTMNISIIEFRVRFGILLEEKK